MLQLRGIFLFMTQSLKIGIDPFWEVLRESKLLPENDFDRLRQKSDSLQFQDSDSIASWLVEEKVLTPLQSKVLLAGHPGPFEFGRYRVIGGSDSKLWLARDRKTAFPVWLHFHQGEDHRDLERWNELEQKAERLAAIEHPSLIRVYETIVTRDYRFVATAVGGKQSLAEKMPLKRRLNEKQAVGVVREVATAITELHKNSIEHGSLTLDHIYPDAKSGVMRLLPPVIDSGESPAVTDSEGLGRILYRLLTGRDAPDQERLAKVGNKKFIDTLSTRNVRPPVSELILESLLTGESFEPNAFLERLDLVSETKPKKRTNAPLSGEAAFLAGLSPWKEEPPVLPKKVPTLTSNDDPDAPPVSPKRLSMAIPVGLALLAFATCIGIGAVVANLKKLDPPRVVAEKDSDANSTEELDAANAVKAKQEQLAELLATQSYVQELVSDNSETLWESPTTGFPIDVSKVPPAPRMIAAVNWSSIYQSERSLRSLKSLGPSVDRQIKGLEARLGFPLSEFESTVISLHSNLSFQYDTCVVATFSEPTALETCLQNWGQPAAIVGMEDAFEKSGLAWWIAKSPTGNEVASFVVGPTELVQQVATGEAAVLSGTMLELVQSSDASRDVNLVLPMISLYNTEGQNLFSGQRKWMNELRLTLPESVRGFSVSLHHDDGDYVEFRVDHTTQLKPKEAASLVRQRVSETLERTSLSLQQRQALPYWEPVRARYGAMLTELSKQLRWDNEFGEVVGNAWLPPGAMHNLFAATELAMAFEPGERAVAGVSKPNTPQTLEELLATKRNLNIANPPDLNVLLKNIREEILDQYLELPFEFNIQIAGTDLQKEGITQNQRPGPLQIEDTSLSDILTQVMVSANPNRDITGASDPECKLVWVLTDDPEAAGKKMVLITTRAAAVEKGLTLPNAFTAQP